MLRNKSCDLPHPMMLDKERTVAASTVSSGRDVIMEKRSMHKGLSALAAGIAIVLALLVSPVQALASSNPYYSVKVNSGYLALRTYPSYEDWNEIGELYTDDVVEILDSTSNANYWWIYSPRLCKEGYVNKKYLRYCGCNESRNTTRPSGDTYQVQVSKGYLALRTSPVYDDANIVGELYTGDTVTFISKYNNDYWWVYSPKHGREGFVNCNYLRGQRSNDSGYRSSYGNYSVSVAKGYLALRTYPSYEDWNEIGELYTGDVVTVLSKPSGDYWWVYSYKYNREGYVNKNYLV